MNSNLTVSTRSTDLIYTWSTGLNRSTGLIDHPWKRSDSELFWTSVEMTEKKVCFLLVFFVLFCAIALAGYHFRNEGKQLYNKYFVGNDTTQSTGAAMLPGTTPSINVQSPRALPVQSARLWKRRRFLGNHWVFVNCFGDSTDLVIQAIWRFHPFDDFTELSVQQNKSVDRPPSCPIDIVHPIENVSRECIL